MILILAIIFTVVLVLGVTAATQEGMIGHRFRVFAEKSNLKIAQPILLCHWCMPSLWSFVGYTFSFMYCGIDLNMLWFYPIVLFSSMLLCGLIWGIIQLVIKNAA